MLHHFLLNILLILHLLLCVIKFIFAPCSIKYFTVVSFPLEHAYNNGVSPLPLFTLISAPCSTKYFTNVSSPVAHTENNGVSS